MYGSVALHLPLCKGTGCIHGILFCSHLQANLDDKLSDPLVKDSWVTSHPCLVPPGCLQPVIAFVTTFSVILHGCLRVNSSAVLLLSVLGGRSPFGLTQDP